MRDSSLHEALLNRLGNTLIKFCNQELEFLKGFSNRADNKQELNFDLNEDFEENNRE